MSERKPGRRERRVAEVKERILRTAKAVFAKRGYRQATTREIAEEADVAEGSIFYHFGIKRGLLLAVIDSIVNELLGSPSPALSDKLPCPGSPVPLDELFTWATEMLRRRFALVKQNRSLLSVLMHEVQLDAELRQLYGERMRQATAKMESRLNELMAKGKLRPINAAVVARAMLSSYFSFLIPPFDPRLEDLSPEEIATSLMDLYWHGLCILPDDQTEDNTGG